MDIEVREVRDFLGTHAPWQGLAAAQLDALAPHLALRYYRRGTTLYSVGEPNNTVYVLRSGAVDLLGADERLVERVEPGGMFGVSSVLNRTSSPLRVVAIEDSLVITVPGSQFVTLAGADEEFAAFFQATSDMRLRRAVGRTRESRTGQIALGRTVGSLLARGPLQAPSTTSIAEAAQLMTEHRVSALLLVDAGHLVGIVTDRDLRSKVVAAGHDTSAPVAEVMTPHPITISPDARVFEVLLEMTSRAIHHLPVVDHGRLLGLVSSGDVMRLDRAHPIYIAGDINRQADAEGVARVCQRIPRLVAEHIETDASAAEISRLLSTISDAATRRLIKLAIDEFGPAPTVDGAPVAWAWVALGSVARHEARLGSDQDHAIILDDAATALGPDDLAWFTRVAARVVHGLEAAGYPPCHGEVMATNWCFTATQWRAKFSHWLNTPDSMEVMHGQIFFDARAVYGEAQLVDDLLSWLATQAPGATRFLAHLASHAVAWEPPLGFFKGFVLERGGDHANTLDLKAASHAIIQLARVHALSAGSPEVTTEARLQVAVDAGKLDARLASALVDAAEFIQHLRLAHQAEALLTGHEPDNHLAPQTLNTLDQRTLKEAFVVIERAHRSLAYAHRTHLI
ncbi:DUF294 nucleotidyltransferase-like domain-containing protein [Propionibacteriaceae bacterium G57]|uniref:DUF294 nucleotidyltransferase-like domain-containing protein n=1 Tax=Aestuariimicrobium sp. G57 TaxID=3418485 RepID=UPI003DA77094